MVVFLVLWASLTVIALYSVLVVWLGSRASRPRRTKLRLVGCRKARRASSAETRSRAAQNREKLFVREDRGPLKSPTETFENSDRFSVANKEKGK